MGKGRRYGCDLCSYSDESESRLLFHMQTHADGVLNSATDVSFPSTSRSQSFCQHKERHEREEADECESGNRPIPSSSSSIAAATSPIKTQSPTETVSCEVGAGADEALPPEPHPSTAHTVAVGGVSESEESNASENSGAEELPDSPETVVLVEDSPLECTTESSTSTDSDSSDYAQRFLEDQLNSEYFSRIVSDIISEEISGAMSALSTQVSEESSQVQGPSSPQASTSFDLAVPPATSVTKRGRGRPRKKERPTEPGRAVPFDPAVHKVTDVEMQEDEGRNPPENVQPKRKRGRPRKINNPVATPWKSSDGKETLTEPTPSSFGGSGTLFADPRSIFQQQLTERRKDDCGKNLVEKENPGNSILQAKRKGRPRRSEAAPSTSIQIPSTSREAKNTNIVEQKPPEYLKTRSSSTGLRVTKRKRNDLQGKRSFSDGRAPRKATDEKKKRGSSKRPSVLSEKFEFFLCGYCNYKHRIKDILLQHMLRHIMY